MANRATFSQSPRLGVHLFRLHHYVLCNEASANSPNNLAARRITTSLPKAMGIVADNNLVDLRDIQNLAGLFTALSGTVCFINSNPPNNPSLWRVFMRSYTTAPDNIPVLWFRDLTPEIVKIVIMLPRGGRIDTSIPGPTRA